MVRYKKLIQNSKRESWRKFCTDSSTTKNVAKLIKIASGNRGGCVSLIKNSNGVQIDSPDDMVDEMMTTHFPGCQEVGAADCHRSTLAGWVDVYAQKNINAKIGNKIPRRQLNWVNSDLIDRIDIHKVRESFDTFTNKKAPGPDGFKPEVLKNLGTRELQMIVGLYKASIATGYTPLLWRNMNVCFLPKPKRKNYDTAKDYRPITLSNFLLKGLERVILWEIEECIKGTPLKNQHAFTKGKSTDSAIGEVINKVEKHIYNNQYCLAIFLDIAGAFDNLRFDKVAAAMSRKGIDSQITEWYNNLLKNRVLVGEFAGKSSRKCPTRGSPQGGIVSPCAWNLCADTVFDDFDLPAELFKYADDDVIMIGGIDPNVLIGIANLNIKKMIKWGEGNGLVYSSKKTQAMLFTLKMKKSIPKLNKIMMGTDKIELSDKVNYLGVTLDPKLAWNKHIQDRITKAKGILMAAKNTISNNWGLSPEKAMWVYKAIARPIVSYGCQIWAGKERTKANTESLKRLQRLAMTLTTGARRSTPTCSMELLLDLLPLDLFCKKTALMSRARCRTLNEKWDGLGKNKRIGFRRNLDNNLSLFFPKNTPMDDIPKERIPCNTKVNFESQKLNLGPNSINVFTDGSSEGADTGAGWFIMEDEHILCDGSRNLGPIATVFQGEVVAINEALSWIDDEKLWGYDITVHTDSQAAMGAVKNSLCCSQTVKSLKLCLNKVAQCNNICINWVKGHADTTGNEFADYLAKKGNTTMARPGEKRIPVSKAVLKQRIAKNLRKTWSDKFLNEERYRQTKALITESDPNLGRRLLTMKRRDISRALKFFTGHGNFGYMMKNYYKTSESDTCRFCREAIEEAAHIVVDCPFFENFRWQRQLCLEKEGKKDTIGDLICDLLTISDIKSHDF